MHNAVVIACQITNHSLGGSNILPSTDVAFVSLFAMFLFVVAHMEVAKFPLSCFGLQISWTCHCHVLPLSTPMFSASGCWSDVFGNGMCAVTFPALGPASVSQGEGESSGRIILVESLPRGERESLIDKSSSSKSPPSEGITTCSPHHVHQHYPRRP